MPFWKSKKEQKVTLNDNSSDKVRVFGKNEVIMPPVQMFWLRPQPDHTYKLCLMEVVIFHQNDLWFMTRNQVLQLQSFYELISCYFPPMLMMVEYDGWLYPLESRMLHKFDPQIICDLYLKPPPEIIANWTADYCHDTTMKLESLQRWQKRYRRNVINDDLYYLHFCRKIAAFLTAPLDKDPPMLDLDDIRRTAPKLDDNENFDQTAIVNVLTERKLKKLNQNTDESSASSLTSLLKSTDTNKPRIPYVIDPSVLESIIQLAKDSVERVFQLIIETKIANREKEGNQLSQAKKDQIAQDFRKTSYKNIKTFAEVIFPKMLRQEGFVDTEFKPTRTFEAMNKVTFLNREIPMDFTIIERFRKEIYSKSGIFMDDLMQALFLEASENIIPNIIKFFIDLFKIRNRMTRGFGIQYNPTLGFFITIDTRNYKKDDPLSGLQITESIYKFPIRFQLVQDEQNFNESHLNPDMINKLINDQACSQHPLSVKGHEAAFRALDAIYSHLYQMQHLFPNSIKTWSEEEIIRFLPEIYEIARLVYLYSNISKKIDKKTGKEYKQIPTLISIAGRPESDSDEYTGSKCNKLTMGTVLKIFYAFKKHVPESTLEKDYIQQLSDTDIFKWRGFRAETQQRSTEVHHFAHLYEIQNDGERSCNLPLVHYCMIVELLTKINILFDFQALFKDIASPLWYQKGGYSHIDFTDQTQLKTNFPLTFDEFCAGIPRELKEINMAIIEEGDLNPSVGINPKMGNYLFIITQSMAEKELVGLLLGTFYRYIDQDSEGRPLFGHWLPLHEVIDILVPEKKNVGIGMILTQFEEDTTFAPYVQKIRKFDFLDSPLNFLDKKIAFSDFCFVHRRRPFITEYLGKNIRSDPEYVIESVIIYSVMRLLGIPVILIAEQDAIDDYLIYLPPDTIIIVKEAFETIIHQAISIYQGDLLAALRSNAPANKEFFNFYDENNHTQWESVNQLITKRSRRVKRVLKENII